MKLLLIGSDVPHRTHDREGVTAVNIVLNELIRSLAEEGHEITFQPVFNAFRKAGTLTPAEEVEFASLAETGVATLPPIYPARYAGPTASAGRVVGAGRRAIRLLFGPRIEDFYPAVRLSQEMAKRVKDARPDAILTVWSPEGVAATHGIKSVPRVAFHGDIEFQPSEARIRNPDLFGGVNGSPAVRTSGAAGAGVAALRQEVSLRQFRLAHLKLMADVDVIANVTACNAEFYRAQRHSRSLYVGNVWSDPGAVGRAPSLRSGRPIKIIGHMGGLGQTGTTFGLRFLLAEVVPALRDVMHDLPYEVHVIGGGQVVPALVPLTNQPGLVMRGYVKDLDAELKSSNAFLLLNNAGWYKAAYTRHMVAWSMGLCLIAHADSRKAIPEISHKENALMGSTGRDVAEMVRLAATDGALNERIRLAGRETFEKHFSRKAVGEKVSALLREAVNRHRAGGRS